MLRIMLIIVVVPAADFILPGGFGGLGSVDVVPEVLCVTVPKHCTLTTAVPDQHSADVNVTT